MKYTQLNHKKNGFVTRSKTQVKRNPLRSLNSAEACIKLKTTIARKQQ